MRITYDKFRHIIMPSNDFKKLSIHMAALNVELRKALKEAALECDVLDIMNLSGINMHASNKFDINATIELNPKNVTIPIDLSQKLKQSILPKIDAIAKKFGFVYKETVSYASYYVYEKCDLVYIGYLQSLAQGSFIWTGADVTITTRKRTFKEFIHDLFCKNK